MNLNDQPPMSRDHLDRKHTEEIRRMRDHARKLEEENRRLRIIIGEAALRALTQTKRDTDGG